MIILDTNVVSEPLQRAPQPSVVDWLDAQAPESLYLTAIAAIAASRRFSIATRNVKDFQGCRVTLINPWDPAP